MGSIRHLLLALYIKLKGGRCLIHVGREGFAVRDLTFGPNNTLYGLTNAIGSTSRLITIDPLTGRGSLVGEIGLELAGLGYNPQNRRMFAGELLHANNLYEINPSSGGIIGGGFVLGARLISLTPDPASEKLFGINVLPNIPATALVSVDPSTMTAQHIGGLGGLLFSSIESVTRTDPKQEFLAAFEELPEVFKYFQPLVPLTPDDLRTNLEATETAVNAAHRLGPPTGTVPIEASLLDVLDLFSSLLCVKGNGTSCLGLVVDSVVPELSGLWSVGLCISGGPFALVPCTKVVVKIAMPLFAEVVDFAADPGLPDFRLLLAEIPIQTSTRPNSQEKRGSQCSTPANLDSSEIS